MRRKEGISLITLIITIVVVIILAAAIILSLSGNNPINNASIASLSQTKDSIETGIATYVSSVKSKTLGKYGTKNIILGDITSSVDLSSYKIVTEEESVIINGEEEIVVYKIDSQKFKSKIDELPEAPTEDCSWYLDGKGKVYLIFDENGQAPEWMTNKNDQIDNTTLLAFVTYKYGVIGEGVDSAVTNKITAGRVAANPNRYYGARVTNYTANEVSNWKIFHSDGRHIYLISSDYIPLTSVPKTKGDLEIKNQEAEYTKSAPLTPAITDSNYVGSDSIKNTSVRKWLSYISEYPQSTKPNMQAVAYLLDTEVWNCFKIEGKADYAIGGPTLDMLAASYNKIHESKKIEYKIIEKGYDVKWSTDESFDDDKWDISGISTSESLYVLPSYETSGANAMWLASPSGASTNNLMYVPCNGSVYTTGYSDTHLGFRPIVCLSSGVQMEQNDDGSVSIN